MATRIIILISTNNTIKNILKIIKDTVLVIGQNTHTHCEKAFIFSNSKWSALSFFA
jgi:hypothetical protein